MAAPPDGEVLTKSLQDEVTCPLCLDVFEDPKILSCHHIYCKAPCLEGLALRSGYRSILCPECRKITPVPGNDVANLPPAFQINRLKEVFRRMQSQQSQDSSAASTEDVDLGTQSGQIRGSVAHVTLLSTSKCFAAPARSSSVETALLLTVAMITMFMIQWRRWLLATDSLF